MPETDPLAPVATLPELDAILNRWELKRNHQVLGLSAVTDGVDKLNLVQTQIYMGAADLERLFTVEVPKGARAADLAAATTEEGKAKAREAFLTFATQHIMADNVICYAEIFLGTDGGKVQTEVLLLRKALPMEPSFVYRDKAEAELPAGLKPAAASDAFMKFMPFIFQWEGETYENDPDDPGGETKFGIDKRSHPGVDIKNLTKDQAMAIYWTEWQHVGCTSLPSPYAEVYFNCAVNMGAGRAKSFDKVAKGNSRAFIDLQEAYYRKLGQSPKRKKYLKGWLNRTNALRARFGLL